MTSSASGGPFAELIPRCEPLRRVAASEPALLLALALPGALDAPSAGLETALNRRLSLAADGDLAAAQRILRRARRRELCRLALRELTGRVNVLESARELSGLAGAVCRAALSFCERWSRVEHGEPAAGHGGFCALALGKLGGDELNFSSDIDLIFLYRQDGTTTGGRRGATSHRELYTRLAERFIRLLAEGTPEGFCYRVDVSLRPEGRNGPLVNPLDAVLRYYESYGRSWERLALLRARPLAGDGALARDLLSALEPFVFRRSMDFGVLDELRDLKRRIELEAARRGDDLKLGPGGIREIEFFAQALELLHGGRRPSLRRRDLAGLLGALEAEGLLPARDAARLADAYRFLRRVEHRLQMQDDRQTHLLPEDAASREVLARSLGYEDPSALQADLARHRAVAREAFEALLQTHEAPRAPRELEVQARLALETSSPEESRTAALRALGFGRTDAALSALHRLSRRGAPFGPGSGSGSHRRFVALLEELSQAADPDRALAHFADWACALRAPEGQLGLLERDPSALRRLCGLFGSSDLLSHELLRHPERFDVLLPRRLMQPAKNLASLRDELAGRLAPHEDPEARLAAACRWRNEEILRVGLLDLAGELPVEAVSEQLSDLALAVLGELLEMASAEVGARHGRPGNGATLCLMALGSLGGREMTYGSDLDLLFLYSSPGESEGGSRGRVENREHFARLAQRLIALLSLPLRDGTLYRIDSRLRPSGNQGALVTSLSAFRDYHAGHSALWERQALLKASFAAGDADLFRRVVEEVLDPAVYRAGSDSAAMAEEIARLRHRMEAELAGERSGRYNPKLGRGGLTDIEFTVQYLQLVHGHRFPSLRRASTLQAIEELSALRLLSSADGRELSDDLRFLRRLEGRLRIARDVRQTHLPESRADLDALARRLGFGAEAGWTPGDRLLHDYTQRTGRVRGIFERILGRGDA
ncbi:MAG: bifunctional [glutamate--ammonia ligase]-adenylyl-L-tyrosine phosphorylase/[glutamate--ammonia-ligase] adenylyltransferase [Myxococcales bacterium]